MKQIILALFMVMLVASPAYSQDMVEETEAGVDQSSILHPLDRALEEIQILFAGSQKAKALLRLKQADERFAEMRQIERRTNVSVVKNKLTLLNKANRQRELALSKANISMTKAEEKEKIDLLQLLENSLTTHTTKLNELSERLPEASRQGISNAINQSSKAKRVIREQLLERMEMSKK